MKSTKAVKLDELDLKFLNEIPLIAEVLSSTTSKVNQLFQPIYKRLYDQCTIKKPQGWGIDLKRTERGFVFPFFESEDGANLTELDNCFQIRNRITIEYKQEKKLLSQIEIACGLYYSINDDYRFVPYFYFCIQNTLKIKNGIYHFPLSFYEEVKSNYKDLDFDIWHPEIYGHYEGIQIVIEVDSIESKIELAADTFIDDIVPVFLNYLDKERVK